MTAYELASLHAQLGQTVNAQLANWLAILSVYLGAGYLVAHRMSFPAAVAVSFIGGGTLVLFARMISQSLESFVGVSAEIQKLARGGGGLEWHQATKIPTFMIEWFPTNSFVAMLVVVAAAIYFFFSSRHQNRAAIPPAQQVGSTGATTD